MERVVHPRFRCVLPFIRIGSMNAIRATWAGLHVLTPRGRRPSLRREPPALPLMRGRAPSGRDAGTMADRWPAAQPGEIVTGTSKEAV